MAKYTKTATRFIADPTCIPRLGVSKEMGIAMGVRADNAAEAVRQIAPYDEAGKGEHYRDQIDSDVRIVDGRFVGRVNAHKFTSAWLEFGTRFMRAMAPLRRGVEMTGLRLSSVRRGRRRA